MTQFFKNNGDIFSIFLLERKLKIKSVEQLYFGDLQFKIEIDPERYRGTGIDIPPLSECYKVFDLTISTKKTTLGMLNELFNHENGLEDYAGHGSGFKDDKKDFHNNNKTGGI